MNKSLNQVAYLDSTRVNYSTKGQFTTSRKISNCYHNENCYICL